MSTASNIYSHSYLVVGVIRLADVGCLPTQSFIHCLPSILLPTLICPKKAVAAIKQFRLQKAVQQFSSV